MEVPTYLSLQPADSRVGPTQLRSFSALAIPINPLSKAVQLLRPPWNIQFDNNRGFSVFSPALFPADSSRVPWKLTVFFPVGIWWLQIAELSDSAGAACVGNASDFIFIKQSRLMSPTPVLLWIGGIITSLGKDGETDLRPWDHGPKFLPPERRAGKPLVGRWQKWKPKY